MNRSKRYSPEIRERAVRMVFEHQSEYESEWAAMCSPRTANTTQSHTTHAIAGLVFHLTSQFQYPHRQQQARSSKQDKVHRTDSFHRSRFPGP